MTLADRIETEEPTRELAEALWQCVDDMGEDGHCVCPATKQHAIEVLKKWGLSAALARIKEADDG